MADQSQTPEATPLGREEIARRITAAEREVLALCEGPNRRGGRRWRMTIPVESTDSDIVLMDALVAARQMLAALEEKP